MVDSVALTASTVRTVSPLLAAAAKSAGSSIRTNFANWLNLQSHKEIAENLLKIGIVKTIWSGGKDIFIDEFYYPSRIEHNEEAQTIDHINQLPSGNIVIQGIVGQGKSIFMRHLACSSLNNIDRIYIPVFIELQKIGEDYTINQAIKDNLEFLGLTVNAATIKHLSSKEMLVILLDGFDEISENYVKKAIHEIEQLQRRYPKTKIIISSRPISGIQRLAGFDVCDLTPLTSDDYLPFLNKLNLDAVKTHNITEAITSSSHSIKELISTPLMLTLVVWVYESEQEIPATLKQFFEKLFHVVFTRHDSLKAGFKREHFSGLSESKLQILFEAFCFMVVQNGFGRSLERSLFQDAFEQAMEYSEGCECDVDNFRKDIVKVACLMLEEGLDLTTFLHKSILDYFAAAFIMHNDDELAEEFYTEAFQNYSTWMHTLRFLQDADTYRHSRFYILKHFPTEALWLEKALATKTTNNFHDVIAEKLKNFRLMLNKEGHFVGWRTSPIEDSDQFYDDLERSIVIPCIRKFKSDVPPELIKSILPDIDLEGSKGFEVTLTILINNLGVETFRENLEILLISYNRQIEDAEKIVATQAKKKLIFGKRER